MNRGLRKYSLCVLGLIVAALVFSIAPASALMPPEVYAKASRESKIKAIATVVDVKVVLVGERYTSKVVSFVLKYALEKGVPETFTGTCLSKDSEEQRANAMVGGDTYFYPHIGDTVFVTIQEKSGPITSMTPMTPELERVVREEPERLKYGVTEVFFEE
ncbi:hypothetical protein [uncultured Pseudodesulfovibrio sp.]|uniref:hypothetical protein n=1 Tax=uncultured Pseudodesulfovibrio sp. TaxID=2035858 RepID=UPI0029C9675D|nr:hypothetical protein [uncultured Pseudodesulfovibrio sp.]